MTEKEDLHIQNNAFRSQHDKKSTNTENKRFFISCRHLIPDQSLAFRFAESLENAGHNVFIDKSIPMGANWVRTIKEEIEQSDYLLLLLTKETAANEFVLEEVSLAKDLNKTILPVRVQYPFPEPLPYILSIYLRTIQKEYWESDEDTPRIVEKILDVVGGQTNINVEPDIGPEIGGIQQTAPQPYFDPRNLIIPGMALDIDSTFYIPRKADEDVLSAVQKSRGIVTVRGPRQTGKTSLIMQVYAFVNSVKKRNQNDTEKHIRPVFIDFQAFTVKELQSSDMIWRAIAIRIAEQLKLKKWELSLWDPTVSYNRNFSDFLDSYVFEKDEEPLLICFDEIDRVFTFPARHDFFASVRAFYNRGAIDPSWKKVRWLLGTSSEPSFFIDDLTKSPFNIGLRVELNAFTDKEVAEFAYLHGLKRNSETVDKIIKYVGGRPYLVHLILYHMTKDPASCDQLFDINNKIFRDHLNRFLIHFQKEKKLGETMRDVISGMGCEDFKIANRLEAAGLVRWNEEQKVVPFCRLYTEYFGRELR